MGRVYGLPVVDIVGTLAGAEILSRSTEYSRMIVYPLTFVAGEVAHWATGTETLVTKRVKDMY